MENINEQHVFAAKAGVTGAAALLAAWTGWFGWLVLVWVVCMVIDYATGSAAAARAGKWSSEAARNGCWHKAGEIIAVAVAALADILLGLVLNNVPALTLPWDYAVLLCPVVVVWYIVTELGSIIENVDKLGAPVPAFLRKLLAALKHTVGSAGDELASGDEQESDK